MKQEDTNKPVVAAEVGRKAPMGLVALCAAVWLAALATSAYYLTEWLQARQDLSVTETKIELAKQDL